MSPVVAISYVWQKAIDLLHAALGFHEYGNNGNPYSKWQYNVEFPAGGWCCSFASYIAYMAGFRFGSDAQCGDKGFASTNILEPWAKKHGLWRDRNYRAKPGDLIIFDWNGDGATDHVETVEFDDGVRIITIGGNTGNAVERRVRDRTYVKFFTALTASSQAAPPPPSPAVIRYLAGLVAWIVSVSKDPIESGNPASGRITTLNELLVDAGMIARPKNMNIFSKATHDGVWHVQDIVGTRHNGNVAGSLVAHWLVYRHN